MEFQNSIRRITDTGTGKKRRFNSDNVFHIQYRGENFVSTGSSDIISSSSTQDSITAIELEVESSSNEDNFSYEEKSSVEMESSSAKMEHYRRPKKMSKTSRTPSAAELDEFFSNAEKYEQKRFAEKYNYDIVKDVPIEGGSGRYQWIRL